MKKRFAAVSLLLCTLLLSGCASLLDREYSVMEKHTSKYWESDAGDTLRAESYQDVVNDLLLLVSERREVANLRLYGESRDAAAEIMERAAAEVKQETAVGSYAVEYITAQIWAQYGNYEASVRIAYRRSEAQMDAVVNATSTAALERLLDDAMRNNRTELAVRIGYWEDTDFERVEDAIVANREKWEEESDLQWVASYYPAQGDVGLIEFRLERVPETGITPDPEITPDETEPAEPAEAPGETPSDVSGEVPADVSGELPVETPGEATGENLPAEGADAVVSAPGAEENAGEQPLTGGADAPAAGEAVRPAEGAAGAEPAVIT